MAEALNLGAIMDLLPAGMRGLPGCNCAFRDFAAGDRFDGWHDRYCEVREWFQRVIAAALSASSPAEKRRFNYRCPDCGREAYETRDEFQEHIDACEPSAPATPGTDSADEAQAEDASSW